MTGTEGLTLMAAMCSGVSPRMFLRMVLAWAEEGVAGTGLSGCMELLPLCCTAAVRRKAMDTNCTSLPCTWIPLHPADVNTTTTGRVTYPNMLGRKDVQNTTFQVFSLSSFTWFHVTLCYLAISTYHIGKEEHIPMW